MVSKLAGFFGNRKKLGFTTGSVVLATILALNLGSVSIVPVTVEAAGFEFRVPSLTVRGEQYLAIQSNVALAANIEEEPDFGYQSFDIADVKGLAYAKIEPSYTPYEPPPADTIEPAPEPIKPVNNTSAPNPTTIDDQRPPDNVTWISPGKVVVGNFHAGGRAEYPITIHNGKDVTTEFAVYYRIPDHVPEDTTKAPNMVQDWVIVADPTPVLAPYETRDILVVLAMPQTAVDPAPKWEFWIGVKDNSQTGMVQTELCTRWIISMREG